MKHFIILNILIFLLSIESNLKNLTSKIQATDLKIHFINLQIKIVKSLLKNNQKHNAKYNSKLN